MNTVQWYIIAITLAVEAFIIGFAVGEAYADHKRYYK